MGRRPSIGPTDAEIEILHILWKCGPSTVRTVCEELNKIRETGYTTALKLLQIMFEKQLVHRDESSRTHVYEAAVERDAVQKKMVGVMLDRFFEGSCETLVLGALRAKSPSRDELANIRRLLDDYEKQKV